MKKLVVLLGSLWCLTAIPAYALQCGNRLVSPGESKTDVWHRCGDPETTDWRVIYRAVPVAAPLFSDPRYPSRAVTYVPVVIEVWTYNLGPQRFIQELSFEEGRLIEIRSLGYGY